MKVVVRNKTSHREKQLMLLLWFDVSSCCCSLLLKLMTQGLHQCIDIAHCITLSHTNVVFVPLQTIGTRCDCQAFFSHPSVVCIILFSSQSIHLSVTFHRFSCNTAGSALDKSEFQHKTTYRTHTNGKFRVRSYTEDTLELLHH